MLQIIVVTGGQVVLDRMSIPKLPLYGQESLANRNNLAGQFKYSEWPLWESPSLLQELRSQELWRVNWAVLSLSCHLAGLGGGGEVV